MLKFILIVIIIYMLYRLLIDFLLPVTKTASQLRNKIKEMQEEQMHYSNKQNNTRTQTSETPQKPTETEYIDFEEVK